MVNATTKKESQLSAKTIREVKSSEFQQWNVAQMVEKSWASFVGEVAFPFHWLTITKTKYTETRLEHVCGITAKVIENKRFPSQLLHRDFFNFD